MSSYSDFYRWLVDATRRPQELLKSLLNIPLLITRCHMFEPHLMNRNERSIDSIGYVFNVYFFTLPLNGSRNAKLKNVGYLRAIEQNYRADHG